MFEYTARINFTKYKLKTKPVKLMSSKALAEISNFSYCELTLLNKYIRSHNTAFINHCFIQTIVCGYISTKTFLIQVKLVANG